MTDKQDDSGPAFPRAASAISDRDMPLVSSDNGDPGMTLRQWYAGLAMLAVVEAARGYLAEDERDPTSIQTLQARNYLVNALAALEKP